jgi:protein-tyrosine phosphatase
MNNANQRPVLFLCTGNYYRSRYAELYWNHRWADSTGVRAVSAGFRPSPLNPGPIAPSVIDRCGAQGISLEDPRMPLQAAEADLEAAGLIVALYDAEHRPYVAELFPSYAERIVYWQVPDLGELSVAEALPRIEAAVDALAAELLATRPPAP